MADQIIKTKNGRTMGKIRGAGKLLYAYASNGKRVGRYNPTNDTTYEANGRRYGKGNQLSALIAAAWEKRK